MNGPYILWMVHAFYGWSIHSMDGPYILWMVHAFYGWSIHSMDGPLIITKCISYLMGFLMVGLGIQMEQNGLHGMSIDKIKYESATLPTTNYCRNEKKNQAIIFITTGILSL